MAICFLQLPYLVLLFGLSRSRAKAENMTMATTTHISPMASMKQFPSNTFNLLQPFPSVFHGFQRKPPLISITAKSPSQNFSLQKFVPVSACLAVLLWSSPGIIIFDQSFLLWCYCCLHSLKLYLWTMIAWGESRIWILGRWPQMLVTSFWI